MTGRSRDQHTRGMKNRLRLTTAVSVAIGVVIVICALVVIPSPGERAQVSDATRASDRFDRSVERFLTSVYAAISARFDDDMVDYSSARTLIETKIAAAPLISPRGTTTYGRLHSERYRNATGRRKIALAPLRSFSSYLESTAVPGLKFVKAGEKLVLVSPSKLLDGVAVYSGAPLRDLVAPPLTKASKKFKVLRAPTGAELLKLDLSRYAKDILAMTKDGAAKIDRGLPFFFDLGTRPRDLYRRLEAVALMIHRDAMVRVGALDPAASVAPF